MKSTFSRLYKWSTPKKTILVQTYHAEYLTWSSYIIAGLAWNSKFGGRARARAGVDTPPAGLDRSMGGRAGFSGSTSTQQVDRSVEPLQRARKKAIDRARSVIQLSVESTLYSFHARRRDNQINFRLNLLRVPIFSYDDFPKK
jgi:hypothetical protein